MPVTELRVELAGGGGACQDALVLHIDLIKSGFQGPGLIQEGEVPAAWSLGEDDRALLGSLGELAALVEGLQGILSAHGFHDR